MVSIMPGMDMAEPERTDTSSGLTAPPNCLPVCCSSQAMFSRTLPINPSGSRLLAM